MDIEETPRADGISEESEHESDTAGHMMPNMEISRQAAAQRERDIRRNLERHALEEEARRPHRTEPKR